jgi:hypothetical protein
MIFQVSYGNNQQNTVIIDKLINTLLLHFLNLPKLNWKSVEILPVLMSACVTNCG